MDVVQWRKDLPPSGKDKTEVADQLVVGLIGSQYQRNAPECPEFLDEVLEYACINFQTQCKASSLRKSHQFSADRVADDVVTRDNMADWTSVYDRDKVGIMTPDEMKRLCSEPGRDFIGIVALTMAKHFGKVKPRWIWEIQEALGRNVHAYDRDTLPEYRNSVDKHIINDVISELFDK